MRMAGWRVGAAALLSLLISIPAFACGFEDPSSIGFRRGALDLSFPKSLHVQGALTQAQLSGVLAVPARTTTVDPFGGGFRRAAAVLRRLGDELPNPSVAAMASRSPWS